MVKITYKGETRDIPQRYIPKSLSAEERKKQIKSIFEGGKKDRPKVNIKSRKSKWRALFEEKYNLKSRKIKDIAKAVGIPKNALEEVYKKGVGAYRSSGSRPNQTEDSWAYGRVYAYIMGSGPTRRIDNHITKKYNVKFKHRIKK
jgi:hypothetical protein